MSGQLGFTIIWWWGRSHRQDHLSQIGGLIDWSAIAAVLQPLRAGRMGRPPYPVLVLFKALLLQRWHDLSDEALEDALCRDLDGRGLIVRHGTLIDASLIAAAVAEPRKQPGGGGSRVDPEVWAKKGNQATFGYKLHIAVDQGSGLVR